jgi:glycine C-acetyltransferase
MVDDAHATGIVGPGGRGTPALHDVVDRVDIVTSTLGKALGGGMGGFIAARQGVVDLLRQRARPYLFSNALAPALLGGGRAGLAHARDDDWRRAQLEANAAQFRTGMTAAGFELSGRGHPIIPVMVGDAKMAAEMSTRLLERGVYVTAFSFPVVPRGTARIRTQMNAAHSAADIDAAMEGFVAVGTELGLIGSTP